MIFLTLKMVQQFRFSFSFQSLNNLYFLFCSVLARKERHLICITVCIFMFNEFFLSIIIILLTQKNNILAIHLLKQKCCRGINNSSDKTEV